MLRPAVFLDRDGVLIARRFPFLLKRSQVEILPGVPDAVAALHRAGFAIVVATNQPALGLGFTTAAEVDAVHDTIRRAVEAAGGKIDGIEICPAWRADTRRKPAPGMLLDAARALGLDLARSWMVGDQARDLAAGRAAGCKTALVNPTPRARRAASQADLAAPDLSQAARRILGATP